MYRTRTHRAPTCIGLQHVGRQLKGANLTPFFSKTTPKLPFLVEQAQMNLNFIFFALSTVGSCPRLLEEHVQKKFAKFDYTDCEIITFEVERKVLFPWAR
jgi:hypothetical protein